MAERMRTWGSNSWKRAELDCPHCGWKGKGTMKMVDFEAVLRSTVPAAFHCPACLKELGFVDFYDVADAKAHWDELSESERETVLANEKAQQRERESRLADPAQLPDLPGEELRFVWDWRPEEGGGWMVLTEGERVVWRQSLGAVSGLGGGVNAFSRLAHLLVVRYGPRARDLAATSAAIEKLAENDAWVHWDSYFVPPVLLRGTARAVEEVRRKVFGGACKG